MFSKLSELTEFANNNGYRIAIYYWDKKTTVYRLWYKDIADAELAPDHTIAPVNALIGPTAYRYGDMTQTVLSIDDLIHRTLLHNTETIPITLNL